MNVDDAEPDALVELELALVGMRFPLLATGAGLVLVLLVLVVSSVVLLGVASFVAAAVLVLFTGLPALLLLGAGGHALLGRDNHTYLVRSVYLQAAFWWVVLATGAVGVGSTLVLLVVAGFMIV